VLPSLVTAVHHPRGGAWLAFGPGQHRCPGDELTLAALEEYTAAFFSRFPFAYLTTRALEWRDGPLATPREARFAVRRLPRGDAGWRSCRRSRLATLASLPGPRTSARPPGPGYRCRIPPGVASPRRCPRRSGLPRRSRAWRGQAPGRGR
jgi:hypothetical protein